MSWKEVPASPVIAGSCAYANVPEPMLEAFVVSVVADGARPDTSPADGCPRCGTPDVSM